MTPPNKITIRNFRDSLGWCRGKLNKEKIEMGIRRELDDRRMFLTVLVHEMVHQYEYQTIGVMTHGKSFQEWEGRIKRCVGLPLSEYVD